MYRPLVVEAVGAVLTVAAMRPAVAAVAQANSFTS
jgi:hypothetical protein